MAKKTPEAVSEEAQTAAAATLATKSAMMTGVLQAMSTLSHEDMMKWFPDAMALAASISPGAAAQNQASIAMKPTGLKEDVGILFSGEDLAEEAKDKIVTLIEHAVDLQVAIAKEALDESYAVRLIEEVSKVQEQMIEKIDSYATYAAEEWVSKNELVIENTFKIRRAEKLIEGLKALFAEVNLDVSEDRVDVAEALESEVEELKGKLNEAVEANIAVRNEMVAMRAMSIFESVTKGMTLIESDKFKKLIEDVDVDVDPEVLERKLTIIKEAHFRAGEGGERLAESISEASPQVLTEELTESVDDAAKAPVDRVVSSYADAISRTTNRYKGARS